MTTLQGFSRPPDPVSSDLASHIATVTGKTITGASVTPTDAIVTGSIAEADRAAIQSALNSYAMNPATVQTMMDASLSAEQKALRVHDTLKSWAADAVAAEAAWPGYTPAQKDAANKLVMVRMGKLCDGLADLLRFLSVS